MLNVVTRGEGLPHGTKRNTARPAQTTRLVPHMGDVSPRCGSTAPSPHHWADLVWDSWRRRGGEEG